MDWKKIIDNLKRDPTAWSLLLSNMITLVFAISQNWDIMTILWIYWYQSVIIGFFTFLKIITLKNFSSGGFEINGVKQKPGKNEKILAAIFFAFHYGFFHFIYAMFLLFFIAVNWQDAMLGNVIPILATAAMFFANHLFSFLYYLNKPKPGQKIEKIMMAPYVRIIPMHLTIIFGGMFLAIGIFPQIVIILFLLLKTASDLVMHSNEHAEQQENNANI